MPEREYYPRTRPKLPSFEVTGDLGMDQFDACDPISAFVDDGDHSDHRSNAILD